MIDLKWEGKTTDPFQIDVSRKLIQDYSLVIGEKNPIHHDPEAAKSGGYPNIIAPLTFPIIFWQHASVLWLENHGPLLHRDQTFIYTEPIVAGRSYVCQIQLKRIINRRNIQFLEHELFGRVESSILKDPSFRANSTLVLKENTYAGTS
ncbi:MaoC family dehydratase N-terminal domain-containing protein [Alkalihalobacillus sp. AL-G]|uniref:FAS1-like dehydratase domain-containing protein n=1 Tax=Alkalihalobacillus sp. AL-G TaxID=2926399 RepID=UPI00272A9E5A|nr:MaoC family dehydratase N-terminal domain-containing protein [Alkalihalobacillus sp. AL-G]WLD91703.1 MaoC family dehydratase N-terminal domain-containing protein [Alkalihalobacillus sp. AL-G]